MILSKIVGIGKVGKTCLLKLSPAHAGPACLSSVLCRTWLLGLRLTLLSNKSPAHSGRACSSLVLHVQDLPVQAQSCTCRTCLLNFSPATIHLLLAGPGFGV